MHLQTSLLSFCPLRQLYLRTRGNPIGVLQEGLRQMAADLHFEATSFECEHCPDHCEVVNIAAEGKLVARWGHRCPLWNLEESAADRRGGKRPVRRAFSLYGAGTTPPHAWTCRQIPAD